jgi:hypothetical protein
MNKGKVPTILFSQDIKNTTNQFKFSMPSGNYMYTPALIINISALCVCVSVWEGGRGVMIPRTNSDYFLKQHQLIFVLEMYCVFLVVGPVFLKII